MILIMSIIADCREDAVIGAIGDAVTVKQLDIGDFIINDSTGAAYAIFERKTYADLVASLKDGRLKEQSYRLKNFGCPRVVYIIEGRRSEEIAGMNIETIDTIIYGLTLRDGYSIIYTQSSQHTAQMLLKVASKVEQYKAEAEADPLSHQTALITGSIVKKTGITPATCYIAQLSQIPGVSITMARAIATRWCNMADLIEFIRVSSGTQEGLNEISDIRPTGEDGKRLGNVIANRIICYLTGVEESPAPKSKSKSKPRPKTKPVAATSPELPLLL